MTADSLTDQPRIIARPDFYWDDLTVGDILRGPGITISEAHLVTWAGLTGDTVSLHLDEEYARATQFGQRIAHGPLTLALALGLITQTGYFNHVIAWLGLDEVRALRPVVLGDTVHPEAELATARRSSKPHQGIWTLAYRAINQHDDVVMSFKSSFMISTHPEA